MITKLTMALAASLMFTPVLALKDDTIKIKLSRQQQVELNKGTIRKYFWYAAGIIIPQLLARTSIIPGTSLITPEGANVFSVGTALRMAGDLGNKDSLNWLGEQAIWGATAHEVLQTRWLPVKKMMDTTLVGTHKFISNFSGTNPSNNSPLNDAIEIVLLGNLFKMLNEYW
jgi:hypothetical protein